MTEDEAKTKWCPFARVMYAEGNDLASSCNRIRSLDSGNENLNPKQSRCIGSECMAWRATDNEIKENADGPIEEGRAMMSSDYVSAGYCGLAGKP